jgi:hypothetical protein
MGRTKFNARSDGFFFIPDTEYGYLYSFWYFIVVLAIAAIFTTFGMVVAGYVQNKSWINFQKQNLTNTHILQDVSTLNYLLGIGLLQQNYYNAVKTRFNVTSAFTGYTDPVGDSFNGTQLQANFLSAATTQTNQVGLLAATIITLCDELPTNLAVGCAPVVACNYTTQNITFLSQAFQLLLNLGNTGEQAYAGSGGAIHDPNIRQFVLGTAEVVGERTAYWRTVLGQSVFPNTFVAGLTQQQVLCATYPTYVNNPTTCAPFSSKGNC